MDARGYISDIRDAVYIKCCSDIKQYIKFALVSMCNAQSTQ